MSHFILNPNGTLSSMRVYISLCFQLKYLMSVNEHLRGSKNILKTQNIRKLPHVLKKYVWFCFVGEKEDKN